MRSIHLLVEVHDNFSQNLCRFKVPDQNTALTVPMFRCRRCDWQAKVGLLKMKQANNKITIQISSNFSELVHFYYKETAVVQCSYIGYSD